MQHWCYGRHLRCDAETHRTHQCCFWERHRRLSVVVHQDRHPGHPHLCGRRATFTQPGSWEARSDDDHAPFGCLAFCMNQMKARSSIRYPTTVPRTGPTVTPARWEWDNDDLPLIADKDMMGDEGN